MGRLARRNVERRFGVFGCIKSLLCFAVQCVPPQKGIVFLFLEPIRCPRTFFVPRGHVARHGFPQGSRLSALQNDDFLRHQRHSFTSVGVTSSSSVSPPSSSVDRKSTRLNSSHSQISYAVFCLKKKNTRRNHPL